MADIGILSWLNETGLSQFPFTTDFGFNGLLVDATFLQYNSFTPILQTIAVNDISVILTIQFDYGVQAVSIPLSGLTSPQKIYDGTRYLGTLIFGYDAADMLNPYLDQIILVNIPFLSHLVKGIPGNAGVYSIDGQFGAIIFTADSNIWYTLSGQNVTFNAVALPALVDIPYLKTLNGVGPTDNSVYIQETQLVKISNDGVGDVQISLAGYSAANLTEALTPTIPTNPDPP